MSIWIKCVIFHLKGINTLLSPYSNHPRMCSQLHGPIPSIKHLFTAVIIQILFIVISEKNRLTWLFWSKVFWNDHKLAIHVCSMDFVLFIIIFDDFLFSMACFVISLWLKDFLLIPNQYESTSEHGYEIHNKIWQMKTD